MDTRGKVARQKGAYKRYWNGGILERGNVKSFFYT